jgi:hypothetical protein
LSPKTNHLLWLFHKSESNPALANRHNFPTERSRHKTHWPFHYYNFGYYKLIKINLPTHFNDLSTLFPHPNSKHRKDPQLLRCMGVGWPFTPCPIPLCIHWHEMKQNKSRFHACIVRAENCHYSKFEIIWCFNHYKKFCSAMVRYFFNFWILAVFGFVTGELGGR